MTDRYENIRKALALLDSGNVYERALGHATLRDQCHPDTIRALLAERDALAALEAARMDAKAVGTVLGGEFHYLRPNHGLHDGTMLYAIDQARGKENSND